MRKPGVGFEYQGRRMIGITDHLRRNYFPHFQATRKGANSKFRGLGLRMGSVADSAVTAFAKTGNYRKMAHSPAAHRLVTFLNRQGLDIVDAHVLVCDPGIGVATEIDVLTHGPHGLVVVENKTTLQTRAEHERTYKKPDRECPLLLKGYLSLLNNEYNHHQLQLAYMLLMLKNTYNIDAGGIVLVASSDGLNHYPINPAILNLARSVVNSQVLFNPVPSNSQYPLLSYRFRAFLPKPFDMPAINIESVSVADFRFCRDDGVNADIKKALSRFKGTVHPLQTGKISFYERPDLVLPVTANIFLKNEHEKSIHLFLVRSLPVDSKMLLHPVSTVKLPSGHKHTLLNAHFLELAVTVAAMDKKTIDSHDFTAHIIYVDVDRDVLLEAEKRRKPLLRSLPKAFLKAVRG